MDTFYAVGMAAGIFAGIWTVCIAGAYGLLAYITHRSRKRAARAS
jgi:hypothetical protein